MQKALDRANISDRDRLIIHNAIADYMEENDIDNPEIGCAKFFGQNPALIDSYLHSIDPNVSISLEKELPKIKEAVKGKKGAFAEYIKQNPDFFGEDGSIKRQEIPQNVNHIPVEKQNIDDARREYIHKMRDGTDNSQSQASKSSVTGTDALAGAEALSSGALLGDAAVTTAGVAAAAAAGTFALDKALDVAFSRDDNTRKQPAPTQAQPAEQPTSQAQQPQALENRPSPFQPAQKEYTANPELLGDAQRNQDLRNKDKERIEVMRQRQEARNQQLLEAQQQPVAPIAQSQTDPAAEQREIMRQRQETRNKVNQQLLEAQQQPVQPSLTILNPPIDATILNPPMDIAKRQAVSQQQPVQPNIAVLNPPMDIARRQSGISAAPAVQQPVAPIAQSQPVQQQVANTSGDQTNVDLAAGFKHNFIKKKGTQIIPAT